ncbi:multidrug effflux MFS transporter, partial [Sphingobium jiangsuense]|uniref:multidrug effflux MFS transporter n=1 Tax=Sphingobium jiangsuense TaxID=870476 RepID=UPI0024E0B286
MSEQADAPPPQGREPTLLFGIALGFLSTLGPFAIDLYLPAMPVMAQALAADSGAVQRTLSAFFLGLAVAQIPMGSLGDRFGRRRPLMGGLLLFMATSLACAMTTDLDQLVMLRFLQGMAACAGTSSVRAMIRDMHSGHSAARLMAFTFLVIGISPVLAPLAGSFLLKLMPWRGLFLILAAAGAIAALTVALLLPETLPPERRSRRKMALWHDFRQLMTTPAFLGWAVVAGLGTTIPFAFVTAAPFVYTHVFGLDGFQYSLLLALNAVVSIVATQFAPGLMRRLGGRRLLVLVAACGLAASLALLALAMAQVPLALFQLWSMLLFSLAGLMVTPAATCALDA